MEGPRELADKPLEIGATNKGIRDSVFICVNQWKINMPCYHHVWFGQDTVLRFDPDKEQFFLRILSSNYGWMPVNKPDYVQWLNLMDKIYHNREAING